MFICILQHSTHKQHRHYTFKFVFILIKLTKSNMKKKSIHGRQAVHAVSALDFTFHFRYK